MVFFDVIKLTNDVPAHYAKLSGHAREGNIYDIVRPHNYIITGCIWQKTFTQLSDNVKYVRRTLQEHYNKRNYHCSIVGTITVCSDGNTWTPSEIHGWHQFVVVITDRYFKLTREIPSAKSTYMQVANNFLDHWVPPFGMLSYLLTDKELHFVGKFFTTFCSFPGVKKTQNDRLTSSNEQKGRALQSHGRAKNLKFCRRAPVCLGPPHTAVNLREQSANTLCDMPVAF